ncbi:hypothetical protein M8A51_18865 [Schlegelella sp. S2-27]|uniref:Uncharacterized protein n=1 Tax=Caldimonas mangrovi TaxID=2944811 RepID=A0ABT0YS75_9BURK|nr:hypothetical protein [Caldimonas mangrovi]MCM5681592.1 hypothetical protein [Caldimonas mangrovi]
MTPRPPRVVTRCLRLGDIPALLDLEHKQWTAEQAATADAFKARITAHPHLCSGAFNARTGELLASLFCKPTAEGDWTAPKDWEANAAVDPGCSDSQKADSLFGISLTSVEPGAALQLIAFQFLAAVKRGYRHVYLGSPMPGLARHLAKHPGACVQRYARATRSGVPIDPQLRYYYHKGFRQLVAVRDNYFPHEASCNYGAILRATVPRAWLRPFLLAVPDAALRTLASLAPRLALPAGTVPRDKRVAKASG